MESTTKISVKVTKGGPYVISGNFELDLPSGETKVCNRNTMLCRCGKSQKKPFCDESHSKYLLDIYSPWF